MRRPACYRMGQRGASADHIAGVLRLDHFEFDDRTNRFVAERDLGAGRERLL
jgi:hypothetical protein